MVFFDFLQGIICGDERPSPWMSNKRRLSRETLWMNVYRDVSVSVALLVNDFLMEGLT